MVNKVKVKVPVVKVEAALAFDGMTLTITLPCGCTAYADRGDVRCVMAGMAEPEGAEFGINFCSSHGKAKVQG